jgi:hypothetical protein
MESQDLQQLKKLDRSGFLLHAVLGCSLAPLHITVIFL